MKDYTSSAAKATIALLIAVVLLGAIPPVELFGLELRRVDIYSLFERAEDFDADITSVYHEQIEYDFNKESIDAQLKEAHNSSKEIKVSERWVIDSLEIEKNTSLEESLRENALPLVTDGQVDIENFDSLATSPLNRFYNKLLHSDSITRIAVMGDSFVEGDILTSDLREMLQLRYGGSGAGFAPTSSPLTKFRRTISTTSKGWRQHNVMQRKSASAADTDMFTLSGWVSRPSSGASVEWRGVTAKRGCESARNVRLLFVAQEDATISVEVNDNFYSKQFHFEGSELMRHITIEAEDIHSVKLTILSGEDSFIGYGAVFDAGNGVSVDNYSVRSDSGQAMFWSNASLNAQIGKAVGGYDLVVLQYGLNIMAQNVYDYTSYAERLENMVSYVRSCFPSAAVLIMGVSERYIKQGDEYVPMNSIAHFSTMQREVARSMGAAFWQTDKAFTIRGGMPSFVERGWAGKDYTHINFNGGEQMGHTLYDAINRAVYRYVQSAPIAIDEQIQTPIYNDSTPFNPELEILPLDSTPLRKIKPRDRGYRWHRGRR